MKSLLHYATVVVAAALAPAGVAGLLVMNAPLATSVFKVALAHAFFLGLPAALILVRKGHESLLIAANVGLLIGAIPIGLFFAVLPVADFSSVDGIPMSVQGVRTSAGWLGVLQASVVFGVCGAIGGTAAWFPGTR